MKKLSTLLAIIAFVVGANAQTSFTDDFESYAEGDYIGVESNIWSTWSGATGGNEDAQVVTDQAQSGTNSIYFSSTGANGGPQDVILPFGGQYNDGLFIFTTAMLVETGNNAYFNFQANSTPGQVWTLDVNAEDGVVAVTEGGAPKAAGFYPEGEWFEMTIEANLSFNIWKFFINGELWGIFSSGANQVASADIFPVQGSSFWIDDISYSWEEVVIPNVNLSSLDLGGIGVLADIAYSPIAEVRNNGLEDITSFDIELTHPGGTISQSVTDINLAAGDVLEVEFDDQITPVEGPQTIEFFVSNVNGNTADDYADDDTYITNRNLIASALGKRAVVEEGTGTWCQFCPRGAVTMERMTNLYNESYVGIAVHNGDPMVVPVYDTGLGLNAFPGGRVDRGSQLGDGQFEANWIERMQVAPKGYVSLGAQYDETTRLLEVVVEAEMVESISGNYRLGFVIAEDGVTGTGSGWAQVNAFSGGDVEVGGYENLPNPVPASMMVYDHVARAIMPDYGGAEGVFPSDLVAGETYAINFAITLPEGWEADELELIGLFYATNNRIDNAYKADLDGAISNGWYDSGNGVVGVKRLPEPDAQIKLFPNPSSGTSFIDIDLNDADHVSVDILSVDGRLVASRDYGTLSGANRLPVNTANFSSGIYMVQIKVGNTQKVLKLLVD